MQGPKFSAGLAGYLFVAITAVSGVLLIKQFLDGTFGHWGEAASAAAEDFGKDKANEVTGPEILYDQARHDYAQNMGWNFVTQGYAGLGFPSRADWLDGAGPASYTYGSTNYPRVESATIWGSMWDAL